MPMILGRPVQYLNTKWCTVHLFPCYCPASTDYTSILHFYTFKNEMLLDILSVGHLGFFWRHWVFIGDNFYFGTIRHPPTCAWSFFKALARPKLARLQPSMRNFYLGTKINLGFLAHSGFFYPKIWRTPWSDPARGVKNFSSHFYWGGLPLLRFYNKVLGGPISSLKMKLKSPFFSICGSQIFQLFLKILKKLLFVICFSK